MTRRRWRGGNASAIYFGCVGEHVGDLFHTASNTPGFVSRIVLSLAAALVGEMRASLSAEEMDALARFTDEFGNTTGDDGAPPFQADGSPSPYHDKVCGVARVLGSV